MPVGKAYPENPLVLGSAKKPPQTLVLGSAKEKLKASEEERSILMRENARLRLSADMLRQIFRKCKSCGHQLRLMEWNRQGYILACDNPICSSDRNPVARISRKQLSSLLGEAVQKKEEESNDNDRHSKGL